MLSILTTVKFTTFLIFFCHESAITPKILATNLWGKFRIIYIYRVIPLSSFSSHSVVCLCWEEEWDGVILISESHEIVNLHNPKLYIAADERRLRERGLYLNLRVMRT